jgi:hypothetical protein
VKAVAAAARGEVGGGCTTSKFPSAVYSYSFEWENGFLSAPSLELQCPYPIGSAKDRNLLCQQGACPESIDSRRKICHTIH